MASIGSDSSKWVDERDAFIAWLRGEFAAANAIIDALCQHLQLLGGSDYDSVLASIHQRRYNWNPVLHMQQYYSIAEVLFSLQQVAYSRNLFVGGGGGAGVGADDKPKGSSMKRGGEADEKSSGGELVELPVLEESKAEQLDFIANGSTAKHVAGKEVGHLNSGHHHPAAKFLDAFEEVDGQQINLLEGLEVHENVFDAQEASRIAALAGESHAAKKKNKSGGEKQRSSKVKAKEVIHFGTIPSEIVTPQQSEETEEKPEKPAPVFTEERAEPMPAFLESIIDRLVTSRVVPASKRPDSCSISVLEPGDYMPPHKHNTFEQPLFILSLGSQSELTFGRGLKNKKEEDSSSKYKVVLPVGSVLVLQGNSAQLVQCSVSPSQTTRTLITFGKMVKKPLKTSPGASPVSPVSPTVSNGVGASTPSFVPGRLQSSPPAPILVPVPAQVLHSQPMIVASIGAYSPVPVVGPGWSTTTPPGVTRVPSPGTGVFFPAKGSHSLYNNNPHHHMNGSHRRLAAAAAAGVHSNGMAAAGKEVAV